MLTGPVLLAISLAGGLTALLTGLTALAQGDLKRLLAASTSSQLGFMFLALGAGCARRGGRPPRRARRDEERPLPRRGGLPARARLDRFRGVGRDRKAAPAHLRRISPSPGIALAGVPPLAGFWSKDAILAATFASPYHPPSSRRSHSLGTIADRGLCRARACGSSGSGAGAGGARRRGSPGWAPGWRCWRRWPSLLGLALRPLGAMPGARDPGGPAGVAFAGLVAGVRVGWPFGWILPWSDRFARIRPAPGRRRGFRLGDGFVEPSWYDPALVVARAVGALDLQLAAIRRRLGVTALAIAAATCTSDRRDHAAVEAVERAGLAIAACTHASGRA